MASETIELQQPASTANQELPRTDASDSPVLENGGPNTIRTNSLMGTYTVTTRSSYSSISRRRRSRDIEAGGVSETAGSTSRSRTRADDAIAPTSSRRSIRGGPTTQRRQRPIPVKDVPSGYSQLAAFIDLEEDLAIFRRFNRLHARLLLYRQADIEELEEELEELDRIEAEEARFDGNPLSALNRSWRKEKDLEEQRVELVKKLRKSMKAYDDELFRYKQKLALKKAAEWQIENVKNWMGNQRPHPLVPTESRFLDDSADMCGLKDSSEDSAVLTAALRSWALDSIGCVSWLFRKRGNPASYGDPDIVYYNTDWKDGLSRLAYATLISVILLAAVIALTYIESDNGRLVCLCVSTFLCAVVMALFTTAKKGEIMGGTAAYCAVLVVFVGSTLGDKKDSGSIMDMAANSTMTP